MNDVYIKVRENVINIHKYVYYLAKKIRFYLLLLFELNPTRNFILLLHIKYYLYAYVLCTSIFPMQLFFHFYFYIVAKHVKSQMLCCDVLF